MGNTPQPGILTQDKESRLHSCERGTGCSVFDLDNASKLVTITPIISRFAGREMRELGAGGGHGDLDQKHELDLTDLVAVQQLFALCVAQIKDETVLKQIVTMLKAHLQKDMKGLKLEAEGDDIENSKLDLNAIPLEELPTLLGEMAKNGPRIKKEEEDVEIVTPPAPTVPTTSAKAQPKAQLPRSITFPYSRHSSHDELRLLVAAFRPRDVWPNTFVKPQHWEEDMSMETMFGDLCDRLPGQTMAFDVKMRSDVAKLEEQRHELQSAQQVRAQADTQQSEDEDEAIEEPASTSPEYQTERDAPPSSPLPMCVETPRPQTYNAVLPNLEVIQPGQVALEQGKPEQETHKRVPIQRAPPKSTPPEHTTPKQAPPKQATPKQVISKQAPCRKATSQQAPAILSTAPRPRSEHALPPSMKTTANPPLSSANHDLTTLDDRIEAAFAADGITSSIDMQATTSLRLAPPSHNPPLPTPAQSSPAPLPSSHGPPQTSNMAKRMTRASTKHVSDTTPDPVASASSIERMNHRKRAYDAAIGGSWADDIELASVPTSTGGWRRARGK